MKLEFLTTHKEIRNSIFPMQTVALKHNWGLRIFFPQNGIIAIKNVIKFISQVETGSHFRGHNKSYLIEKFDRNRKMVNP